MRRRPSSSASILESARSQESAARALASSLAPAWSWDAVYATASATLERSALGLTADKVRAALPVELDKKGLAGAPSALRDLAMWAGGVERGQRLFAPAVLAAPPLEEAGRFATHLFATLWPWTEDDGCTLRIGLWHPDAGIADRTALAALVRAWFDAQDP